MHRGAFHDRFGDTSCIVLVVIHCRSTEQAAEQAKIALASGVHGILLINQIEGPEGSVSTLPLESDFIPIILAVRKAVGDKPFLGINCLAVTADKALPILAELLPDCKIDAYWADDARIDERQPSHAQREAYNISEVWSRFPQFGLYFGGVAFKKQREVAADDWARAAWLAAPFMDVITTSGVATGVAAEVEKLIRFRRSAGNSAIAVGSGVTPDNVDSYLPFVDCLIVATGVSKSFHQLDVEKLNSLMVKCRRYPWYASLMQPRTRRPPSEFAWLDPSAIYGDKHGWSALLGDLRSRIQNEVGEHRVAAIAGIDATGFVTGGALSALLGVPFIIMRKADKLCVETVGIDYTDYSGKQKTLEIRTPLMVATDDDRDGVVVVDQWIETGHTMRAAVELLKTVGLRVISTVTVAAESQGRPLVEVALLEGKVITALNGPVIQKEIDAHFVESFKGHAGFKDR
ncbi:hypothetical protein FOL47_000982 [Perkinsus chesapeaki]|uniref:adenine phosphoribosyltransferase n=1 Tax=Perkinsus chesapeaki TaxID=330153 RepID=A0A7J6MKB9_PERCH|nr:hypothetical protein FOL47_000982 [Perkinsus chesapeaki]